MPRLIEPPALIFNVAPVLSSVPVKLRVPPLRLTVPSPAVVKLPPKLTMPPVCDRVPLLLHDVGLSVSVPALTPSVPLLVKVLGLTVRVCPAVLARIEPLLITVATELWLMLP